MKLKIALTGLLFLGASLVPQVAYAQTSAPEEACMIINRFNNAELIVVGPGASYYCSNLLIENSGLYYPTQRPPDTIRCGERLGLMEVIYGDAFGSGSGVNCRAGGATWGS